MRKAKLLACAHCARVRQKTQENGFRCDLIIGWLVGWLALCFQSRDVRERVSVIEAWPLAKVTLSVRRIAKYLPE